MARQFFYDNQIRRFLLQFVRMFSNFQIEVGSPSASGDRDLLTVPVRYGDMSRNVANILRENSENKVANAPMMSAYISSLKYSRERVQEPNFIDKLHVRQRKYNDSTKTYSRTQSNAVTVERHMPVPYDLTMTLDIFTTNTEMKLQLLEQMLCLFNPALEIQSTDNYVDWTSLSYVELTDVNFTSRTIPIGTEDQIDIASLTFEMPIFLSMPANVKKMGVIHKIVNSVFDAQGDVVASIGNDDLVLGNRLVVTPGRYGAILLNGQAELVDYGLEATKDTGEPTLKDTAKIVTDPKATKPGWAAVLEQYGPINPGITQIRFENEAGNEVVGTIAYHPTDVNILLVTVDTDTIPTNTITAVDAIIKPTNVSSTLVKNVGSRYLILEDIGDSTNTDGPDFWKSTSNVDLIAKANDIIQWDGSQWTVAFDSSATSTVEYFTNATTNIQYKWTGTNWLKSYEGEYRPANWRVVI
jgi:hypothetical protein